jgi:hypothetical protein
MARRESLRNTFHKRPDLIARARKNKMLSRADEAWLANLAKVRAKRNASWAGGAGRPRRRRFMRERRQL